MTTTLEYRRLAKELSFRVSALKSAEEFVEWSKKELHKAQKQFESLTQTP